MNKLMGVLIGLVLSGCAAQRPPLPDDKYQLISRGWITLTECSRTGKIDADTSARGRAYVISAINGYQHDANKLRNTEIAMRKELVVSDADCREMAVSIASKKQQIEHQNATADIQQREVQSIINATKPTQTYCNKIGTQVFCNSF